MTPKHSPLVEDVDMNSPRATDRRATPKDIESLFSGGKKNQPIVEDVDMDGPRATEHRAPCARKDLKCGDCGAVMILRRSEKFDRLFYSCSTFPVCKGAVAAHPDGRPKSAPGDRKTKDARIKAHQVFDRIWQQHRLSRHQAYAWMRQVLKLSDDEGHIGYLTIEQCETLIQMVNKSFPATRTIWEKLRERARMFTEE